MTAPAPLRLTIDLNALAANFQTLARLALPAACGVAVKANAYGLGVAPVAERLWAEGARDFFVATTAEAVDLRACLPLAVIHVLNGLATPSEAARMRAARAQPVLNTPDQLRLWRTLGGGEPCDIMLDTGMHRLGLTDLADLEGLTVDVLLSHLASADDPESPQNAAQLAAFQARSAGLPRRRLSLANSAGVLLGADYAFDLVRPGLGLYGGAPVAGRDVGLQPVARLAAQVLQLNDLPAGASVGYNATWTAARPSRIATLGVGYADGYVRAHSNRGRVLVGETLCPVVGRVSMDLTTVDVTDCPDVRLGDWATLIGDELTLEAVAGRAGLAQYELLTGLGPRAERVYLGEVQALNQGVAVR
jgi:alanine racemase